MVLMLNALMLVAALAAPADEFELQTLDGQTTSGQIAALDKDHLVLQSPSGEQDFPLDKLAVLVRPNQPAVAVRAAAWVELMDGSALAASEYGVKDGQATVCATGGSHELPARSIRWVRFGASGDYSPALLKQWSEITETKAAGDLLVVRKNDALDYLEGVIRDVSADTCQFELDGEVIPVKRSKVAGLVYAHPRPAELPAPLGKLVATDGTRLQLAEVKLVDGIVELTTPVGSSHRVPLQSVLRFDFSSGKVLYLSDVDPDSVSFTPLVGFRQPSESLLEFYAYRRDVGFEQNPLRLDGKVFRKGLALASHTTLLYRLPDKFRLFRATVGIDDATRETGSVQLVIKGDGKSLWEGEVRGSDPARELELEISGVKRLEIVADYGEGLDVGDRLDLADAQVTK